MFSDRWNNQTHPLPLPHNREFGVGGSKNIELEEEVEQCVALSFPPKYFISNWERGGRLRLRKQMKCKRSRKLLKLKTHIILGEYINSNNCSPQQADLSERYTEDTRDAAFLSAGWGFSLIQLPKSSYSSK